MNKSLSMNFAGKMTIRFCVDLCATASNLREKMNFGKPIVATGDPGAPQVFQTQDIVRYSLSHRTPFPARCVIQNHGQHKHTNQCLISFTKGMLTLLKGH